MRVRGQVTSAIAFKTSKTSDTVAVLFQAMLLDIPGDGTKFAGVHALLNSSGALVDPATSQNVTSLQAALITALGIPAQTADIAASTAKMEHVRALLAAQLEITNLFVTNGTSIYIRRETATETGTITVTFENMDGSAATPTGTLTPYSASAATSSTKVSAPAYYDVTSAATGITIGDIVSRLDIFDASALTASAVWLNLTQGTTLSTAPIPGTNVVEQTKNLTADTVIKGTAVDRGALTAVAGKTAAVTAGGSGYVQGDTVTNSAGVFTATTVVSGAITAVTALTPTNFTAAPPTGALAQTATSGAGTGATLTPSFVPVAVQLAPVNTSRRGLSYQNQSSAAAYVSSIATATADFHSLLLNAGDYFESSPQHVGTGTIYAIGTTYGQPIYAREF